MKKIAAGVLTFLIVFTGGSIAEAKTFKNCAALLKVYPTGVAQSKSYVNKGSGPIAKPRVSASIYKANRSKDTDRDGIICERVIAKAKPAITNTAYYGTFKSYCDPDPVVPAGWVKYDQFFRSFGFCTGPYRFKPIDLVKEKPKTPLTELSGLENMQQCKLRNNRGRSNWVGFPSNLQEEQQFAQRNHPSPNTVFQIIPITAPDAPSTGGSPAEDYKIYFDYFKDFIEQSSDFGSNVEFRIPDEWIAFPEPLKPYGIDHTGASQQTRKAFIDKVGAVVDPYINFSGANLNILVVPAGTSLDIMEQGHLSHFMSAEGIVQNITSLTANTVEPGKRRVFSNIQHPLMTIHELYHIGTGLDDHYGNGKMGLEDSGMARWGLMNTGIMDLLGWEKWLVGFWKDQQVRCASPTTESTHWLAPSTVRTTEPKLLVIPFSSDRGLVLESQRAAGFNYRLPEISEGVLAYEIDLSDTRHGYGFKLQLGANKKAQHDSNFRFKNAPLKVGEFITYENLRISVVEAGKYGDVVKVERTG